MLVETIYIIRHGFRLNWVTTNWTSPTGLPRDPPLAAFGEVQAKETAEYFLSLPEDQRPTAIWSSPYYRCLQTAKPIAEALGLPICVEHGLSEWYSPVEPGTGLHPRPAPAAALKPLFPSIDPDAWSSIYYPTRTGEDVDEVHARAADFLRVFVPEAERRFGERAKRVLLCSHAATVIALTRALLGQREMLFRAGCCSLTEVRREKDDGAWGAITVGSGKHLKEGLQRDWGFEDIQIADGKGKQVVNDQGVPGTESEEDFPVGLQISEAARL
ncbi:histidine phosphatase superfamily [Vararia minispora EC-137]|uniref:Histidine phosphatase superfamily n=1 Tax=Vararia minispora EC-137 TaxID=1314806 RepID=A0ACB8QNE5_9AGAM|nr:histidine phosphatase superfamily [Vararia minispora EC-137]